MPRERRSIESDAWKLARGPHDIHAFRWLLYVTPLRPKSNRRRWTCLPGTRGKSGTVNPVDEVRITAEPRRR
ncbi:hypothetical protein B296_00039761 [Ensete ventricosum]|uniref:Uncharacterized protein n=1 Tax=Ensete ventricosum TaxID=4639 RepID=A0A426ZSQ0_ENSVE|nr:hypothetical protein B296_00039761 [Ensete ventricosum]